MRGNHPTLAMLLLVTLSSVAGAALPLTVELEPSSHLARSQGPLPVSLRLDWGGTGLLKGRLHLQVYGDHELLSRVVTDELYLNTGRHRYQVMLPAYANYSGISELTLRLTYVEGQDRHDLPALLLRCPSSWTRRLAVAMVRKPGIMDESLANMIEVLDVSSFGGQMASSDAEEGSARIVLDDLDPGEFPADPLRCCAFDMVVLDAYALLQLTRKQADALLAWVRAGGSAIVIPEGQIQSHQLDLLQQLDAGERALREALSDADVDRYLRTLKTSGMPPSASPQSESLAVDSNGHLVIPESGGLRLRNVGLGRALIMPPGLLKEVNLSSYQWRHAVGFLWKTRHQQMASIARTGLWNHQLARQMSRDEAASFRWPGRPAGVNAVQGAPPAQLEPRPVIGGSEMMQALLPPGIRLVPFGLIVLILVLFLLAIGPLDFWLLGRLGRRKLTWIVFPVITLAFTLFSVWMSNVYMGGSNHRRAVVIRDMDADGAPVRENRLEMLFNSRAGDVTTELKRELFMPLDYQSFFWNDMWTYAYRSMPGVTELVEPPTFTGRVPIQGTVTQRLPQWTPQLNRRLRIPLPDPVSDGLPDESISFDWGQSVDPSSDQSVRLLRERVLDAFGPETHAYLYHRDQRRVLSGDPYLFANVSATTMPVNPAFNLNVMVGMSQPHMRGDFIQELSVRNQGGWFAFMSQVSPGCGPYLEDLAILDSSDPDQCLLVIAVSDGPDTIVYRRVYRRRSQIQREDTAE